MLTPKAYNEQYVAPIMARFENTEYVAEVCADNFFTNSFAEWHRTCADAVADLIGLGCTRRGNVQKLLNLKTEILEALWQELPKAMGIDWEDLPEHLQ